MSPAGRASLSVLLAAAAGGAGWWLSDHREEWQPLVRTLASSGDGQPDEPDDDQTLSRPPHTTPLDLGVGRDQLQAALASPVAPRFVYHEAAPWNGQTCVIGSLGDGRAVVDLVGPTERLSQVRLTLPMSMKDGRVEMPDAVYLVILAREIVPEFSDAGNWIAMALPQATDGVPAITTRGQIRLQLTRLDRFGLVTLEISADSK